MTAFLKIDVCKTCRRSLPWEWVPAVVLNGKALAGTGVWRTQLVQKQCPACLAHMEAERAKEERSVATRKQVIELLGGEKPYREFTFERFEVTRDNHAAFERAKNFMPASENLYLWGACGLGKTHLAHAIARRCAEETLAVAILLAGQLSRKMRAKLPEEEQAAIDALVRAEVLLIDDLGAGKCTEYAQQILQEILDRRDFDDRRGLIITSKYSLAALANRMNDDSVASRLAGLCSFAHIKGTDYRLKRHVSGSVK